MARKESHKKITAIVPTYNEAGRIENVLDVLVTYPDFEEIIVVDDGSTDHTEEVVTDYAVTYIKNKKNQGKGYAMERGVQASKGEILFFLDADIRGLTHKIIEQIIAPVASGEVDMFIGMRNRKIYYLRHVLVFVPLLGGERALTKKLWNSLPAYYKHRFRIEAGLNFYAQNFGNGFKYKVFGGLSQVIKEKKYGFINGMYQRLQMFYNIISAQWRLHFVDMKDIAPKERVEHVIKGAHNKLKNNCT